MKNKFNKYIATLTLLGLLSAPIAAVRAEGKFDEYPVQSAMSSAFYEVLYAIDGEGSSGEEESDAVKAKNALLENANKIAATEGGNFGSVGLFYGAYEPGGIGSVMSALRDPLSASKADIEAYDRAGGGMGHAHQYHQFGLAVSRLKSKAIKTSPNAMSLGSVLDGFNRSAQSFASFGLRILEQWNPAPIVLAFYDSAELNDANNAENHLVVLAKKNDFTRNFIQFFGDRSPIIPSVSNAWVITMTIGVIMFGLGALSVLFNGQKFGMTVRTIMVRFLIASLALPAGAKLMDYGMGYVIDFHESSIVSKDEMLISQNLNFADWYATGFSMPAGTEIEIRKGKFVFDAEDVRDINVHTSSILGGGSSHAAVADRLKEASEVSIGRVKNMMNISFTPAYVKNGSRQYLTSKYYAYANALYENKFEDLKGGVGYIGDVGLRMSGSGGSWTVTSTGAQHGISKIAAYNLMRTTFNANGFAVNSNVSVPTSPVVAIGVVNSSVEKNKAPTLILSLAMVAMLIAGVKGVMEIFSAGVGASIKGGASSAMGSSAGAGELIGGLLALLVGVFGISVIMSFTIQAIDVLWEMIFKLFENVPGDTGSMFEPLVEAVDAIPWVGGLLSPLVSGLGKLLVTILAAYLLPKSAGLPIKGFAQWASSLPGSLASKAQAMENRFTGDYRAGGGSGFGGGYGGSGGIMKEAKESAKNNTRSLGMLAGAASGFIAGKAGQAITNWANNQSIAEDSGLERDGDDTSVQDSTELESGDLETGGLTLDNVSEQEVNDSEGSDELSASEQSTTVENPTTNLPTTSETPTGSVDGSGAEKPTNPADGAVGGTDDPVGGAEGTSETTTTEGENSSFSETKEGTNLSRNDSKNINNGGELSMSSDGESGGGDNAGNDGQIPSAGTSNQSSITNNHSDGSKSQSTTDNSAHTANQQNGGTAIATTHDSIAEGNTIGGSGGSDTTGSGSGTSGGSPASGSPGRDGKSATGKDGKSNSPKSGAGASAKSPQIGSSPTKRSPARSVAAGLGKALSAAGHTDTGRLAAGLGVGVVGMVGSNEMSRRAQSKYEQTKGRGGSPRAGGKGTTPTTAQRNLRSANDAALNHHIEQEQNRAKQNEDRRKNIQQTQERRRQDAIKQNQGGNPTNPVESRREMLSKTLNERLKANRKTGDKKKDAKKNKKVE